MNDYTIITVCSKVPHEHYYCLREFVKSLKGEELIALGTHPNEYGGLGSKPRLLHNYIKEGNIKTKYLIFCDCFDLVFTQSPQYLFEDYLVFEAPLVISAEKNCFPVDLKDEYDKLNPPTSYKYLNSGMIVGEVDAMFEVLKSMDAENIPNDYWDGKQMVNPNDQFYYQQEFLKQPVPIILDYYQVLCNTLHNVEADELEFTDYGIKNKETHQRPCSFHFNGGAKTGGLMQPILKYLNLV